MELYTKCYHKHRINLFSQIQKGKLEICKQIVLVAPNLLIKTLISLNDMRSN